jgi:hypothetical protein
MTTEKMLKIVYEEGETGWADDLGDNRARIANLPIADDLNIDDVVSLKRVDGRLYVDKVVSRTFAKKTALEYDEPHHETYAKIWSALKQAGMKIEGLMEGHCLVAHRLDQDPVAVCKTAGVEVRLYRSQPRLAEIGALS